MEEWKEYKLGDIAIPIKDRIETSILDKDSYISTENMLPNKSGITTSSGVPSGSAVRFQEGDVLISNIRPYFKKIWRACFDGGSSADVICLRATNNIDPLFLYYLLSQDVFFDYVMLGAKGTKMPRGDKSQIMQWPVLLPPINEQKQIAALFKSLDDKIEVNRRINDNLEQQAQALFKSWFVDFEPFKDGEFIESELGMIPKDWTVQPLGKLVTVIDNRGKTPPLCSDTIYPIIDVKSLSGLGRILNYDNCTKFVSHETYQNWFRNGHPQYYDLLLSTVGSLAEIKMFTGGNGCIAQNVVALRNRQMALFLFDYLNYIKPDLISYNIGSVQPSIKVTHIIKHKILVPSNNILNRYSDCCKTITDLINCNCKIMRRLATLRDTLLPKLMSGELKVNDIEKNL